MPTRRRCWRTRSAGRRRRPPSAATIPARAAAASGTSNVMARSARARQCRPLPPARPADVDAMVRAALAAHQRGDLEGAEREYRSALAATPEHPLATHYLGVILYQRNRLDEAMPLLERAAAAAPRRTGVPQQPRTRAGGRRSQRRGGRRLSPRAGAQARSRDRLEQPRPRAAGVEPAARRDRRVSRGRCADAGFRAGPLESFACAACARRIRRRLARVRVAAADSRARAARAHHTRDHAGMASHGPDRRCSSPRSRGWATRCNSSALRSRSQNAACGCSSAGRSRSCACSRRCRASRRSSARAMRCLPTMRMFPCSRSRARWMSARGRYRPRCRTSAPTPRCARRPRRCSRLMRAG